MSKQTEETNIEVVAELCHSQWSEWMKYIFKCGQFNDDGTFTMTKGAVDRWREQMQTNYRYLSKSEKESDRTEAKKFIKLTGEKIGKE